MDTIRTISMMQQCARLLIFSKVLNISIQNGICNFEFPYWNYDFFITFFSILEFTVFYLTIDTIE